MLAVVIIVVILVAGGLGTYLALPAGSSGSHQTTSTVTTCEPATSPRCTTAPSTAVHNAVVSVAFSSVQQGQLVPITVSLPNSLIATSYTFYFGDGTSETTTTASVSHPYQLPGTYYVYATATDANGSCTTTSGPWPR